MARKSLSWAATQRGKNVPLKRKARTSTPDLTGKKYDVLAIVEAKQKGWWIARVKVDGWEYDYRIPARDEIDAMRTIVRMGAVTQAKANPWEL